LPNSAQQQPAICDRNNIIGFPDKKMGDLAIAHKGGEYEKPGY